MQFDLKKFYETAKRPYEAGFSLDLSQREFYGASIPQPVQAQFTAALTAEGIRMTLKAEAEVHGDCALCLDPVRQPCAVATEWIVRERDLTDPDFELPLDEKGKLDVDEWLYQEFTFEIPTVLVCSADCQGLCPECGNKKAACTCQKADETGDAPVDARLSILKSLLN